MMQGRVFSAVVETAALTGGPAADVPVIPPREAGPLGADGKVEVGR